jgi:hypothetical protein
MQQTLKPEHFKTTWLKQSGNLLAADLIGMVAEGALISNIGSFDRAFPAVSNSIISALNVPMYYFQRPIESALSLTKNFEGKDYYDKRLQKTEKERVETLSKAAYHYGLAWAAGWGSMVGAEHFILSPLSRTPPISKSFFMKDAAIHVGLVALMALPSMESSTQRLKDTVKCVAKGFGSGEDSAEDLARVSTFSFLPNFATLGIISGMMYRDGKIKSLQSRLSETATHVISHI